jgi:hypothetical protein
MHATLYAASAHLDTLRDTTAGSLIANPVTLYHQTETIAAVKARIASGHVLNDATVAPVLPPCNHWVLAKGQWGDRGPSPWFASHGLGKGWAGEAGV